MDRLRVVPPYGKSFLHTVKRKSIIIGRSAAVDLHVPDRFLSRRHARLFLEEDSWWIEDLASRNGSWINGSRIDHPTEFGEGDRIRLSNTYLLFGPEPVDLERTPTDFITTEAEVSFQPVHELTFKTGSFDPTELDAIKALEGQAGHLRMLNQIHSSLSQPIDLDNLLELVLDCSFNTLQADQAVIYLKQADGLYQRAAERSIGGSTSEHLESVTLLTKVATEGMTALVNGLETHLEWQEADSMLDQGVHSLVAAPLVDSQGSLGMIAMSATQADSSFGQQDLELLVSLASVASLRIRNMLLTEEAAREAAELERFDEELVLARRIQVSLMPSKEPRIEGFELCGRSRPCRRVSGDFYQMIPRNDGREVIVLLADVVGKGLGASLVTASLEALAVGPIEVGRSPVEICRRLDRRLHARTDTGRFAAMLIACLKADEDKITYSNAGLNPGLLVKSSGRVYRLGSTGPPLGLLPGATYEESTLRMKAEDLLVLYTDGLTEAANFAEEEYGLQRLIEICRSQREKPLDKIAQAIEGDIEDFARGAPCEDDRTLVLARRIH